VCSWSCKVGFSTFKKPFPTLVWSCGSKTRSHHCSKRQRAGLELASFSRNSSVTFQPASAIASRKLYANPLLNLLQRAAQNRMKRRSGVFSQHLLRQRQSEHRTRRQVELRQLLRRIRVDVSIVILVVRTQFGITRAAKAP